MWYPYPLQPGKLGSGEGGLDAILPKTDNLEGAGPKNRKEASLAAPGKTGLACFLSVIQRRSK